MGVHAKELRIGNLVWTKSTATSINQNNEVLTIVCMVRVEDCEEYIPIPLTENYLLRFGFKLMNPDYWIKDEPYIRFYLDNNNELHCSIGDDENGFLYNKIKFIHQLQNLYFALTGEELTLNEA